MCAQRSLRSACAFTQSDQSSLCVQWVAKIPSFLHADSEDSDQTGRIPRLIWVFAGRTCQLCVKQMCWSGEKILLFHFLNRLIWEWVCVYWQKDWGGGSERIALSDGYCTIRLTHLSRLMTKPTNWPLHPAKTQISLGIRSVWSVFAVRRKEHWVLSDPLSALLRLWSDWADA